ncbi:hypothetical protein PHYSODRAFT_527015 [Phytophthora sojae]|uniref:RxLR effector protein n=1 Tax=Phytophthora sojae (strain P6497) TaxID=1094619 RepID=G5A821_PHYSP|nr:hypothetical protein PHYSODRAFT_527015 [Phytophthora sojae]EGZ08047.1 hypothetical protein PHYSODRAFT_527015 [Phytophthora sojae]|eukprot:XP_009536219.1 hypothetical protein PHYSODRAFT_527015 [Phytophthora sojae]
MKFFRCLAVVAMALAAAATVSGSVTEETGVQARHMLAMGDESVMLARGSLRRAQETN